ncbi:helix-turn-helix domain-containing protein [Nitriliruptor alkaliphilus]|uniref:helix-turn-helix domain-containing protein n=1 Tax=Nitriliruptor alkaliphilus TaxID=427918 RepID=UPI0006965E50|nr:helix-turn-helix domain-containing protein [Nitriliruptor alkaliphilus]
MTYREHDPTGPWRREIACAWTATTGPAPADPMAVVPDGCADVLWSSTRGTVIVGPMTRPSVPDFPAGTEHVALRLRPGRTERVLGVPASALIDLNVPVADVVGDAGRRLDERLAAAEGTHGRLAALTQLPGLAPAVELDRAALAALAWLVGGPTRHVADAADRVGLSARQLQRRVVTAIGYGPKRFQRVVRVQRVLAAGPARLGDLAQLAADLGFTDQAHLTREVGQLTGRPPTGALTRGRATLVSGTSKRPEVVVGQAARAPGAAPRAA